MGEDISERFVITKVLMSLPNTYKHFVSAWESAPDEKQTLDNLVARLLIEEERINEKEPQNSSASAFVAKKNIKCYKCNKSGHYQSECNQNKGSGHENRPVKSVITARKWDILKVRAISRRIGKKTVKVTHYGDECK